MTQEEKAKAYDKAREKIAVRFGTNVAEEIFSEFEESEDEKIRKGLINGFNECLKNSQYSNNAQKYWHNIKIEDIFAWLEKQGEQKQYDIDVLEKHITKDSISELAHTVIVRNGWEIVDAKEQNPAWSEEDEVMIKVFDSIIRYIVEVVDKDALERFGTNREELFSWLKSIRPQPKQEWGEEDENYLNTTIAYLKDANEFKKTAEKCITWLKSLRPQSHWKPSDEQMKQLGWIAEQNKDNMIGKELISLYQDLKKLREE